VPVAPVKRILKAPGIKRLKLTYDQLASNFAFNFNLRRYNQPALALQHAHQEYRGDARAGGRASPPSTFRLNVITFCGIGIPFRGCLQGIWAMLGGIRGCLRYILCQKRLRFS